MMSNDSTPISPPELPPFLRQTEAPPEADQLPLQVWLLTMEVAHQRQTLHMMATTLEMLASLIRPPGFEGDDIGENDA